MEYRKSLVNGKDFNYKIQSVLEIIMILDIRRNKKLELIKYLKVKYFDVVTVQLLHNLYILSRVF